MNAVVETCSCYSVTDNNGVLRPVLCPRHQADLRKALAPDGYHVPTYERWFDREQDAKDRVKIIRDRWPADGYGTTTAIYPVGDYWLVRADWSESCD